MTRRNIIIATVLCLFTFIYLAACSISPTLKTVTPGVYSEPTTTHSSNKAIATITANQPTVTNTFTQEVPIETATLTLTPIPTGTPTSRQFYHTPTFDPATIVTATRSPNATCPKVGQNLKFVFPDQKEMGAFGFADDKFTLQYSILEALNQGATLKAIQSAVAKATANSESLDIKPEDIYLKELTGDNVPEIIFENFNRFSIFTCIDGHYILGLDIPSNGLYLVKKILYQDLNRDTIPEIIVKVQDNVAVVLGFTLAIFHWDGSTFRNLCASEHDLAPFYNQKAFAFYHAYRYQVEDIDKNRTLELVIREELIGTHAEAPFYGPWRIVTHIVTWNGSQFALLPPKFDPPVYRFQAVQDGDRALYRGDFVEALKFYEQALNDRNLKGWSKAHFEHMQASLIAEWKKTPTPTALPDDPAEYSTLAAYSRFHILLIHSLQGNFSQALSEYRDLQNDYSYGEPGIAFAQLAKVFWETYEKTNSLGKGCEQARIYAKNHPDEIISQIDITWHGRQTPEFDYYPYVDTEKFICPLE